jgi:hypothetical protein
VQNVGTSLPFLKYLYISTFTSIYNRTSSVLVVFTRDKFRNVCLTWTRIYNNNSGSDRKFQIHVNPDPKLTETHYSLETGTVLIFQQYGISKKSVNKNRKKRKTEINEGGGKKPKGALEINTYRWIAIAEGAASVNIFESQSQGENLMGGGGVGWVSGEIRFTVQTEITSATMDN